MGAKGPDDFNHSTLVKIANMSNIEIKAANSDDPAPLLRFDGWGGITIKNSTGITVKGLEIEGPNLRITANDATKQR